MLSAFPGNRYYCFSLFTFLMLKIWVWNHEILGTHSSEMNTFILFFHALNAMSAESIKRIGLSCFFQGLKCRIFVPGISSYKIKMVVATKSIYQNKNRIFAYRVKKVFFYLFLHIFFLF